MKCWNSAFNAQLGSRVIAVVSCTGRSSENICSGSGGAQEQGKTGWNSIYPPKLVEKLVWVPVISFRKIFITSYAFWCPIMPKLAVLTPWSCDFKDNSKSKNTCIGHFCFFEVLSHLWKDRFRFIKCLPDTLNKFYKCFTGVQTTRSYS
jgi:hypothetical protein